MIVDDTQGDNFISVLVNKLTERRYNTVCVFLLLRVESGKQNLVKIDIVNDLFVATTNIINIRITSERYDSMANGYEQEQAEKKRELQELAERISEVDMRDQCIQQFIRDAKQYVEMPKLTPELLRVFIRRIEVYEKFEKYSRTAGNPIRIHYAFRLPEQEGVPAIDVLAQPTAKTA